MALHDCQTPYDLPELHMTLACLLSMSHPANIWLSNHWEKLHALLISYIPHGLQMLCLISLEPCKHI